MKCKAADLPTLFKADNPAERALRAIKAGLRMLEAVDNQIKPYLQQLWGKSYDIGIGLHYGLVVAGTVGVSNNRRMTVIGDAVNLTSRIEAINKKAGTRFLISEDVYKLVAHKIRINKPIRVEISGKTGEYTLYEVVGIF